MNITLEPMINPENTDDELIKRPTSTRRLFRSPSRVNDIAYSKSTEEIRSLSDLIGRQVTERLLFTSEDLSAHCEHDTSSFRSRPS